MRQRWRSWPTFCRRIAGHAPDTPQIITFNVEEDEPMLRVNIDLGFVPIGAEGEWQKPVGPGGA